MIFKVIAIVLTSAFYFFSLNTPPASAQTSAWSSINNRCVHGYSTVASENDVATFEGIECLVANVLSVAITMIGIAAFVMFLVGSFRYLTAGSNTKGVEGGKNALTFAILGIVVALASFLILRFIANFTGVQTILQFNTQLPGSP